MNFDRNLQLLLSKEVPRMTDAGRQLFNRLLEEAIRGVVVQAFDEKDLAAFHVTKMID